MLNLLLMEERGGMPSWVGRVHPRGLPVVLACIEGVCDIEEVSREERIQLRRRGRLEDGLSLKQL